MWPLIYQIWPWWGYLKKLGPNLMEKPIPNFAGGVVGCQKYYDSDLFRVCVHDHIELIDMCYFYYMKYVTTSVGRQRVGVSVDGSR